MRKLIVGPLAVLLIAALGACGGSAPPTETPTPMPTVTPTSVTAAGVFSAVAPAMASVKSFHFTLDETSTGLTAEGDVVPPDNVSTTVQIMGTSVPIIQTGGKAYILNPLTNQWQVQETGTAAEAAQAFQNPAEILTALNAATNVQSAGSEVIDGVTTDHFTFSVDPSKIPTTTLPGITPDQLKSIKINGEVWIGQQDNLVRQMILDEDLSGVTAAMGTPQPGATPGASPVGPFTKLHETIKLSKFNEPVEIKPPM